LYPCPYTKKLEICHMNKLMYGSYQNYKDISSFRRDIGFRVPEHPLINITFGHRDSESIDDNCLHCRILHHIFF